jgi:hypothetical protein
MMRFDRVEEDQVGAKWGGIIEVFAVITDMRVMTTAVPGFAAITCAMALDHNRDSVLETLFYFRFQI